MFLEGCECALLGCFACRPLARRLSKNLSMGWIVTEDYAGMACMSMALTAGANAAKRLSLIPQDCDPFVLFRACDVDPLCIRVLGGADPAIITCKADRPLHVHVDLNGRLPQSLRGSLDMLAPTVSMKADDRKRCYDCMRNVLEEQAASLFFKESKAFCAKHDKDCPVHPPRLASTRSFSSNNNDDAVLDEASRPWISNHAGHTCIGWSARGKREGEAHESNRAFLIWTAERRQANEDVVFAECTVHFPPKVLCDAVPGRKCVTLFAGPEQLGWPHRRARILNALINLDTCVWMGSDNPGEEFAYLFHRVNVADGSTLTIAPTQDGVLADKRLK